MVVIIYCSDDLVVKHFGTMPSMNDLAVLCILGVDRYYHSLCLRHIRSLGCAVTACLANVRNQAHTQNNVPAYNIEYGSN